MKKYITTAIPYANAAPHIGTAMDYLYADILARYWSNDETEVLVSIGTDEHGTKVEQKAAESEISPQEFVDKLQPEFEKMRQKMNLDFSNIRNTRTTDPDHERRVQEIWKKLEANNCIYKSTYEGWYCSGCEAFLTETEARDMDYKCPDHKRELERLSEENYYLRTSKFTEEIREFIKSSITPEFRAKELLEMIKDGVQDVSISRPKDKLKWGIAVPGDETQVMYVWVDALSNYITALNYPDKDWDKEFWPATVEIVGKDILRFHAIIWPAVLLGLGLELPKQLLVHGFINVDGQKMSKSLGNVVSPSEIIDKYGADAFRYYFTRHIPIFDDGDFTWERFEAAYNGELANDLGNLVSRLANMIQKYGIESTTEATWREGLSRISNEVSQFHASMEKFEFNRAIEAIWAAIQSCNKYIDETKPWELAKTDTDKLTKVLNELWGDIMIIQALLRPFLPETAEKIREVFNGDSVKKPEILFPKM
jgi:methionyl-tRNA synthetase